MLPASTLRRLEELVGTVAALDGRRAASVLSGLCGPLRPAALELLRGLEQSSRGDRHARLASAFAARPSPLAATGIPGELGTEVHRALAGGAAPARASGLARWARRLVGELGAF